MKKVAFYEKIYNYWDTGQKARLAHPPSRSNDGGVSGACIKNRGWKPLPQELPETSPRLNQRR